MTGFVFDFNGTLFLDSEKHEQAWQIFAQKHTGKPLTSPDYANHVHGRNNAEILAYFFGTAIQPEEMTALAEEKEAIYRTLCAADPDNLHLIAGAANFFQQVKQAGYPMNIATAANKANVDFYFEVFQLQRWFEYDQVVFDDGTLASKPDPQPYLRAMQKCRLKPDEVTVFEDSTTGIKAANRAHVAQIIAVGRQGNEAELMALPNVALVIADFNDPQLQQLL